MVADEVHRFPSGLVFEISDADRTVRSIWPDGIELAGTSTVNIETTAAARALGYPGNVAEAVWSMNRQHDLLHHVVAVAEGWPWSVVLRHAAERRPLAADFGQREERLVFLLQRALNAGLPGIVP